LTFSISLFFILLHFSFVVLLSSIHFLFVIINHWNHFLRLNFKSVKCICNCIFISSYNNNIIGMSQKLHGLMKYRS
jgi:hypothetical protein